jgi:uncharacterized DUF497 family protein
MRFEWDESKNDSNVAKHGVNFATARRVFRDPYVTTMLERFVDGEERWHAFGLIQGILFLVVFTIREDEDEEVFRIISARRATGAERRDFERGR